MALFIFPSFLLIKRKVTLSTHSLCLHYLEDEGSMFLWCHNPEDHNMSHLYSFKVVRLTVQCFDKLENLKYTQKPMVQNIFQYVVRNF
jgi:hypothetical protein